MSSDQGRFEGMDVPVDPEARWGSLALEWIRTLPAGDTRTYTSEDVTRAIGLPDEPGSPANGAVGAAIARALRLGWIARVGDTPARNVRQHGARIGVWRRLRT